MATWLTPAAEVWDERFGEGTFPVGMAAKALSPLYRAGRPPETIAAHLATYLARTEPQFINLHKFAATFATWDPAQGELALVDEFGMLTPAGLKALGGSRG